MLTPVEIPCCIKIFGNVHNERRTFRYSGRFQKNNKGNYGWCHKYKFAQFLAGSILRHNHKLKSKCCKQVCAKYSLDQHFRNFVVCWHSKKAKQISRYNSHTNVLILHASSITDHSKKSDDLFFLGRSSHFRAT